LKPLSHPLYLIQLVDEPGCDRFDALSIAIEQ
jgi:hypothetical protein